MGARAQIEGSQGEHIRVFAGGFGKIPLHRHINPAQLAVRACVSACMRDCVGACMHACVCDRESERLID